MPRERRTAICSPKAGGMAVALNAMGARFRSMIDVTIAYPDGAPSFWDLACGRAGAVRVRMRQLPVPQAFCEADYSRDKAFRAEFHHWLGQQWQARTRKSRPDGAGRRHASILMARAAYARAGSTCPRSRRSRCADSPPSRIRRA